MKINGNKRRGMGSRQKKSLGFLALLCLLFIAFGCAAKTYRAHPELEIRSKAIKNPGVISPDVKIFELTAGGIRELRDDWRKKGEENVLSAVTESLREKEIEIKTLTVDEDIQEEMEDIEALYRAVSISIILHTYGPFVFPEKKKNFDYSIGSIERILEKFGSDALIFTYGFDEISTKGRKALKVASIVAGAFTGVVIMPRSGITVVSVALVDASGTIFWYSIKGSEGGYDLRKHKSTSKLVKDILSGFPRLGK